MFICFTIIFFCIFILTFFSNTIPFLDKLNCLNFINACHFISLINTLSNCNKMIVEAMADAQWKCLRTLRIADNNNTEKLQYNRENLKKWKSVTHTLYMNIHRFIILFHYKGDTACALIKNLEYLLSTWFL